MQQTLKRLQRTWKHQHYENLQKSNYGQALQAQLHVIFLKELDDQVYGKTGQVLDPLQISNAKNYGAYSGIINETRTDYTKAKNLLVDVYKRMLTNKTALRLFIGAGAAYTFMGNNAEAGVLDKSLQKIFQNGGQKLFSVAKDFN